MASLWNRPNIYFRRTAAYDLNHEGPTLDMLSSPRHESWAGTTLYVSGPIEPCRGVPEVIAYAPDQIRLSPN